MEKLELYGWRATRPRSGLTLAQLLAGAGRALDLVLHLVPAVVAVALIWQALVMAENTPPIPPTVEIDFPEVHFPDAEWSPDETISQPILPR